MQAVCYNCFRYIQEGAPCPYCGYDAKRDEGKFRIALRPGTPLANRYVIGRVLGQGGFGVTYVALDSQTRARVAIKEYLPTEFVSRAFGTVALELISEDRQSNFDYGKQQFLAEARTLAEFVGGEHIVSIHSYFEENGTAYFAMEYLEGRNLKQYMEDHGGPLPVHEANRILLPVMEALDWVHSKGIVHRDISPDNIVIKKDGAAKLIDFGAARQSTGEKSKSLDVVLKHGFAPMEQYSRRGRQGPFTDVYAMAATYYYAITGKVPPDAVDRMSEDELVSPSALGVKIRKSTEQVLLKALAVNAPERWQRMSEFYSALLETMPLPFSPEAGEEIRAETDPRESYHLQKSARGEQDYKAVIETSEKHKGYEDSSEHISQRGEAVTAIKEGQSPKTNANSKSLTHKKIENLSKKSKKTSAGIIALAVLLLFISVAGFLVTNSTAFRYRKALYLQKKGNYEEAVSLFTELGEYHDAAEQISKTRYAEGLARREQGDWDGARAAFEQAGDYSESTTQISATWYAEGLANREAQDWDGARAAFEQAGDYSDSATQISATWYAEGDYREAVKDLPGAETAYQMAGDYLDADIRLSEIRYQRAEELRKTGNYSESALLYAQIPDYKDVREIIQTDSNLYNAALRTPGSIITFGSYEQDNDYENGKEPIEWLVLSTEDGKSLLISRFALDCQPYNTMWFDVTWKSCSLRRWLDSSFLKDAFSAEEQEKIPTMLIPAGTNPYYSTDPGPATEDRVFVLSFSEAYKYLQPDDKRLCKATPYTIAQGCYTNQNQTCFWWLRSPGSASLLATYVYLDGSVSQAGDRVDYGARAVRPALWISLDS